MSKSSHRTPANGRFFTERELRDAQPGDTLREPGGLRGALGKTGRIVWTYRYRAPGSGRIREMGCGTWPGEAMRDTRRNRDVAGQQVADGIDPIVARDERRRAGAAALELERIETEKRLAAELEAERRNAEDERTVHDLFSEWVERGVARKDGNAELKRCFRADILPAIGDVAIRELGERPIEDMLRGVAGRGAYRYAEMLYINLRQMFRWGERRQPWRRLLVDGNPLDLVEIKRMLPQGYTGRRSRVLSDAEIAELRDRLDSIRRGYGDAPEGARYSVERPIGERQEIAIWIGLSTLCRVGELMMAQWRNVDLDRGEWLIPADESKGRADSVGDFVVFLSPLSLHLFRRLHELTGHARYCFPARHETTHVELRSIGKSIADRQAPLKYRTTGRRRRRESDSLVLSEGSNGDWTFHDLRRTGATIMQRLGVSLDVIDRCQNHVLGGSAVRRHYLLYAYETEKREAWFRLGRHLEEILFESREIA